jgi:hypothetical protein
LVYVLNSWDKTPQHESGSFSSRCLGLLNWGYISSTSCIYSSQCDMLIEQDGYPTWYKIRERRIVYSPHATPPSPRPVELAWLTWYMYTHVQFFAEEWFFTSCAVMVREMWVGKRIMSFTLPRKIAHGCTCIMSTTQAPLALGLEE